MSEVEKDAGVRFMDKGGNKNTANLIYGQFNHTTSRPLEDGYPDPHLHAHCFIANATFDKESGKWKAIDYKSISEHTNYYEAVFHSELSLRLKNLGIDIRKKGRFYEVKNIGDKLLEKFSRRTSLIEKLTKKHNITNPLTKQELGKKTRKIKKNDLNRDNILSNWQSRLSGDELELLESYKAKDKLKSKEVEDYNSQEKHQLEGISSEVALEELDYRSIYDFESSSYIDKKLLANNPEQHAFVVKKSDIEVNIVVEDSEQLESRKKVARQSLRLAKEHIIERQSVFHKKHLIDIALRFSYGGIVKSDLEEVITEDGDLISSKKQPEKLTTKLVKKEEIAIVSLIKKGMNLYKPLFKDKELKDYEFKSVIFRTKVLDTQEQKQAVLSILGSSNMVNYIKGRAGTGKTTAIEEIKLAFEAKGKKLFAIAPTTTARDELSKVGFNEDAKTIASFLHSKDHSYLEGQLLVVDEAGFVGSNDMNRVIQIAKDNNAKVLLVGDSSQHRSVGRGDALRLIEEHTSIKPLELSKINRQKVEEYKEVIKNISKGEFQEAFKGLKSMDAIKEIKSIEKRNEQIADRYIDLKSKGSTLVISPTHKEGDQVTASIREKLSEQGLLGNKSSEFTRLINRNYTQSQKSQWDSYQEGDVIEFNQKSDASFTVKGARFVIDKVADGEVFIKEAISPPENKDSKLDKDNNIEQIEPRIRKLDLSDSGKFTVYGQKNIDISVGDQVRITQKSEALSGQQLLNGNLYKVVGINETENKINILSSGGNIYEVDKDLGHLNYGYVVTSHASQGKTVDNLIVSQSSATASVAGKEQFYVSLSRGRYAAEIYTDDASRLEDVVSNNSEKRELASEDNYEVENIINKQKAIDEVEIKPEQRHKGQEIDRER